MRLRLLTPLLVLALAPAAHAGTGGAGVGSHPGYATASDGSVSVSTRSDGLVTRRKTFTGTIPVSDAGRTVTIERYDEIGLQWAAITHTTAGDDGSFSATWKPDHAGAERVRARVESPDARAASAAPELGITLYKPAKATWYGPGFYRHKTACGERMSKTLVGVANKTRPCGTLIKFFYKGHTVTAPVVDRGPFANGAKWDITYAAAQQLGFDATDTVGALQLASR